MRSASRACPDPLTIQCRTASPDHTPWEQSGQPVRCDLWTGLLCNADDVEGPACFNFQVRLGCLKQTADCCKSAVITLFRNRLCVSIVDDFPQRQNSVQTLYPRKSSSDETINRSPIVCIRKEEEQMRTLKVLLSMSEFGGLQKH